MTVVIPMAGAGSRFAVAGYTQPKPFIDVNGRMMVEYVLNGLRAPGVRYVLVIQRRFAAEHDDRLQYLRERYRVDFAYVDQLTQGAACTALAAYEEIDQDDEVVFADSDSFLSAGIFKRFVDDARARRLGGSMITFRSTDPRYSFIEVGVDGKAVRTREKDPISDHAIAGVYYFAKERDFVRFAIRQMIYGDREKGEYYMSSVYNQAIRAGLNIGCFDIGEDEWTCLGTPMQLEEYCSKKL